ncbi:MAG: redox-sensing transcriptional repressor Rex [Butyricicoccus sp.]|nr:redox-sensing transcriptional repressor Rex [Butyricicoccus sp.]
MKKAYISNNVIRRLPRYLRKLDELKKDGVERISSGELGNQMGLTSSQIRQDFSCFGEFGQQGYGYNVRALHHEIETILGLGKKFSVILIGVGNIGRALIGNFSFSKFNFRFLGAFEIRRDLIGSSIAGCQVMDVEEQDEFIRENNIDIAILTVPRPSAQAVADKLIESGIRGIWNFTDVELDAHGSGVIIENIHFSDSLLTLSYLLGAEEGER